MSVSDDVQTRFKTALESFVDRVRRDDKILAAILFGSLSYDAVWEYSDIDVYLVCKDEKHPIAGFCLVEHGINIHAVLYPRAKFRQMLDGAAQGSFGARFSSRVTTLFARRTRTRATSVRKIGSSRLFASRQACCPPS